MTMVLKPQQVYRVKKAMQIKFVLEYTAFLGDESVRVEPGLLFCYVGRSLGSNTFVPVGEGHADYEQGDRKSTRLNSSHVRISYAVFCLKKKKKKQIYNTSKLTEPTIRILIYHIYCVYPNASPHYFAHIHIFFFYLFFF